jgi:DNA-binding transcriptional ArsR family regulator
MTKAKPKPEVRQRVHEAVTRYPGLHLRGLERQVGVSAPLVQYHVRRLIEAGFIESREKGGYVRFYATPKAKSARLKPEDQALVGLLREEVPLHIALLLLDEGDLTHGALVERLGIAKSTVSYHLAKLAQAEVVVRGEGAAIRLADRERVYRMLLAHEPTPDLIDAFADLWGALYD